VPISAISVRVLQTLRRHRSLSAAAAGGIVAAAIVVANQPRGSDLLPATGPVQAATQRHAAQTPAPEPLRLLLDPIAFHDDTAGRHRAPQIAAATGILVDIDRGTILWEHDPHRPRPPASTVKLLSSLVALENFDPDQLVTITPDALTQRGNETKMGLVAGQQLSVSDLLAGMLTVSGNDAATALAVDTVGMNRFVEAMNAQASALGLRDSIFTTPVGLDDAAMRSSAYDLAVIAAADVENFDLFRQIVSQKDLVVPRSAGHPAFYLHNLNLLLDFYPAAVGIKPGLTGDAGPCLVAMAVRGNHRLIAVLLNDPHLYFDARALLDWGFVQEGLPSQIPVPTPTPTPRLAPRHR